MSDLDLRVEEVPGDLVAGKYRLERKLGQGGMGSVWLARNVDLDAPVAIKLIHPAAPLHEASLRLKREARVEARVRHPAVVRVFDYGETDVGTPFVVMEVLEGTSFADVLTRAGALSPLIAARVLLPVVEGLAAAHQAGIVHRDVKPENIFLANVGRYVQPKVIDFGIAKLDSWSPEPTITVHGAVMGSPAYMSPEQARGVAEVDRRADVWALCVVLYEAVSGSPPFHGNTYNAILRQIVEEPVPPLAGRAEGEAALWQILERGLEKDPEDRIASMDELGRLLVDFLVAHGVTQGVSGEPISAAVFSDCSPSSGTRPRASAGSAAFPEQRAPSEHGITLAPRMPSRSRISTLRRNAAGGAFVFATVAALVGGAYRFVAPEPAAASVAVTPAVGTVSARSSSTPVLVETRVAPSAAPSAEPVRTLAVTPVAPKAVARKHRAKALPASPMPSAAAVVAASTVSPVSPNVLSDLKVPY